MKILRLINQKEWSAINERLNNKESLIENEFHDMFLTEFVKYNIINNSSTISDKFVCIDNQKQHYRQNVKSGLFNSSFSPFAFTIMNIPSSKFEEQYSLLHEEVFIIIFL